MSGVQIAIDVEGLDAVVAKLERLPSLSRVLVLEAGGSMIESQTRRRIISEKTSPDGAAWKPNRAETSILKRAGHLLASIHYRVFGSEVRIGSGLVYAAIHQFGGTIVPKNASKLVFNGLDGLVFADQVTIPARPYLGVSAANRAELEPVLLTAISKALH